MNKLMWELAVQRSSSSSYLRRELATLRVGAQRRMERPRRPDRDIDGAVDRPPTHARPGRTLRREVRW